MNPGPMHAFGLFLVALTKHPDPTGATIWTPTTARRTTIDAGPVDDLPPEVDLFVRSGQLTLYRTWPIDPDHAADCTRCR